jgi:hypothetical protein
MLTAACTYAYVQIIHIFMFHLGLCLTGKERGNPVSVCPAFCPMFTIDSPYISAGFLSILTVQLPAWNYGSIGCVYQFGTPNVEPK